MAEILLLLSKFYYMKIYCLKFIKVGNYFEILLLKMLLLSKNKSKIHTTHSTKKFYNYKSTFQSKFEH